MTKKTNPKLSTAEKVRRMIDQGHNNKAIIEKLGIKPQIVYNMRYQINKARGLGAIGKASPAPTTGIGAPPKRRTRKVKAGTGITPAPINPPANAVPVYQAGHPSIEEVRKTFGTPGEFKELPVTMIEPPSLWQRIVRFFKGN